MSREVAERRDAGRGRRTVGLAAAVGLACASVGLAGVGGASAQMAVGCSSTVGLTTCTYDDVGVDQYFLKVPSDVRTMHVLARGGAGGGVLGGRGAVVEADVAVTPGSTVYVIVGSGGGTGAGAGGGYAALGTAPLDDGVDALTGRLIVAGGGGGAGSGAGGDAGAAAVGGGGAGTGNSGGLAGPGGTAGQLGVGGAGGIGGGGGGGLYGGGGGAAGGGGGSSLMPAGATVTLAGARLGARIEVSFSTRQLAATGSSDTGSTGTGSAGSSGSSDSSAPFGSSGS